MRSDRRQSTPSKGLLAISGITAIAAALRCFQLGNRELWLDETLSYLFARASPDELFALLRLDSGPPLYYGLLGLWQTAFGSSEIALRSLSALASVALIPALFVVGRRILGERAALAAAFLAAFLPIHVAFAQEARAYSLLSLVVLVAFGALASWLQEERHWKLAVYSLALASALLLHNYALLLLPAHGLWILCLRDLRRLRYVVFAWAATALLYLPWVAVLKAQLDHGSPTHWMTWVWNDYGFPDILGAGFATLTPGGPSPDYLGLEPSMWGSSFPILLTFLLLVLGLKGMQGHWREHREIWIGLLCTILVPPVAAIVLSATRSPIYLPGRLEQLTLPSFCLLLGWGLAGLRRRSLAGIVAFAWAVLALSSLGAYYRVETVDGQRALAKQISEQMKSGDRIVTVGLSRMPIEYYLRDRSAELDWISFPAEMKDHPGSIQEQAMLEDRDALIAEARALTERISAQGGGGRSFLVGTEDALTNLLIQTLTSDPRPRRDRDLGQYRLTRLDLNERLFLIEYPMGSGSP